MESHAMTAHSVNTEGLQRLQALMGGAAAAAAASRKSPQSSQKGELIDQVLLRNHAT